MLNAFKTLLAPLAALLSSMATAPASAQGLGFNVFNNTVGLITNVHVRPLSVAMNPSLNLLGMNAIPTGNVRTVLFVPVAPGCDYEVVLIVQIDPQSIARERVVNYFNVCALHTIFVNRLAPNNYNVTWQNVR